MIKLNDLQKQWEILRDASWVLKEAADDAVRVCKDGTIQKVEKSEKNGKLIRGNFLIQPITAQCI